MANGVYTHAEIISQGEAWASTLDQVSRQYDELTAELDGASQAEWLVTGCGSTYYASVGAAANLRRLGVRANAFPAADIVYFPQMLPRGDTNLLTISRSGITTETLWAQDVFRKVYPNGKVVSITTQPETPLAIGADFILSADAAQELSVAQTRSFTSMYLLSQCFAGALTGENDLVERLKKLPSALEKLIAQVGDLPQEIGSDLTLTRFFFLGGGPYFGLASEMMLKTKEMTCSWAEAFHTLEFRHGPMSVVNDESLVVCLVSDSQEDAEVKVLREMKKLGARILVLTEGSSNTDWSGLDYVVKLHSGLDEWERGPLYLPFIQWMAYYRTQAKGLDPDLPVNLKAVIEL
jgi:glucosamine--fructose-6-phosphate aminotransferase (isomerizing)